MGTSEVETFVAAANMFLGQSDSPILISKYLGGMTKSEIMVVLVSGMGSMSANVLGVCVSAIGALCPGQRQTLARLAPRAMLGGFAVSVLSSMIVGLVTLF